MHQAIALARLTFFLRAGRIRRFLAFSIDSWICFLPGSIIIQFGLGGQNPEAAIIGFYTLCVGALFFPFRDSIGMGRGISKRLLKINVISLRSGIAPTAVQSLVRNIPLAALTLLNNLVSLNEDKAYVPYIILSSLK